MTKELNVNYGAKFVSKNTLEVRMKDDGNEEYDTVYVYKIPDDCCVKSFFSIVAGNIFMIAALRKHLVDLEETMKSEAFLKSVNDTSYILMDKYNSFMINEQIEECY